MASVRPTRRTWLAPLVSLIAACSGGSCGGDPPGNDALPGAVACAGPDRQVPTGSVVRLDGGCSRLTAEAGGSGFLGVHWELYSKPAGSEAFLSSRETPWPSFTADRDGLYVMVLEAWATTKRAPVSEDWVTVTARAGNSGPAAFARPSRLRVKVGEWAALDGTASHDGDGDPLTFRWSFVEPSPDALDDVGSACPRFEAQSVATRAVELVVSDGLDESAPSRVLVDVTSVIENAPPLADAGPDQGARPGTPVLLDGSGSRDPDGDPLAFAWRLLWRPPGSASAVVAPDAATTPFTPDVEGRYLLQLVVSDGRSEPAADPRDGLDACVVHAGTENLPPVALALGPAAAVTGEVVPLDGSGSTDPDGDPLNHRWTLLSAPQGSAAAPSPPDAESAALAADLPGTYVVRLVVDDGAETDADHLTIRVTQAGANRPPVANAGPDQLDAVAGSPVTVDGGGSDDPDGDVINFLWTIAAAPAGSAASLLGADTATASFTPDVAGTYVLRLEVSDGLLADADTVRIEARGNRAPIADAGADPAPVVVGALVQLDGSRSSDPDGDPITFQWSVDSAPAASAAALGAATTPYATLVPDLAGTYRIRLVVSDGSASGHDTVDVVAEEATVNRPPVADAGPDRTVLVGSPVTLDGSLSGDPDGDTISFQWTLVQRPDGSLAALLGGTTSAPSFTPDVAGEYAVRLIVSDGVLESAPDVVLVTASAAVPLALETALPIQGGLEEGLYLLVDAGGPDTLRVVPVSSPDASSERSALAVGPWAGTQAGFFPMWAWTIASRSHPDPVDDTATPRFVLRRTSDGVHFAVTVDFTVESYTVRVDALSGWRCAAGPETCP